jgi:hypothetical protein
MIPDIDIWRAAALMIKHYGDTADIEAAGKADSLLAEGDTEGQRVWMLIAKAIDEQGSAWRVEALKPHRSRTWHPASGARRLLLNRALPLLIILGGIAFALWLPPERPASTISGQAIIVDGDTLEVQGERIRILDIDAPESDQPCRRSDAESHSLSDSQRSIPAESSGEMLRFCDLKSRRATGSERALWRLVVSRSTVTV